LGLEEARPKETLNIRVIGDFINSLTGVENQNFDIGRRNYEAVKFVGFSRCDYDLESIFKFLLVLKICFLMQYECMMSCNMSALYVPHQKKRLTNIDGVDIIGGNSHSSPRLVLIRQFCAIVVSVPTEKHNRYIFTYVITYPPSDVHAFNAMWTTLHMLRERIQVLQK
jgi:hypothetical protein